MSTESENMNQRIRDNAVLKQLRSAVGLEENDYEPASRIEETELGLYAAYPFPFSGPTKPKAAGLNDAFLHEKKLKLFMHAQDKDHREESYEYLGELRAELSQLSPVQVAALCRSRDERENTALHYAAKAGNLDVCKLLARGGADIKAEGENKMKPLQFAARYGDEKRASDVWDCMEWIIGEYEKRCFDMREKDKYKFSILHHAIQNTNWVENPIVVRNLLRTGKFPIKEAERQGNTSLHLAAHLDEKENHKLFDIFFDKDNNVPTTELRDCLTAKNNVGQTPIHMACAVGNVDSVNQLLDAGMESGIPVMETINTPDYNGMLPISFATTSRNVNMMEVLIEKGAIVNEETILAAARYNNQSFSMPILCSGLVRSWNEC